MTGKDLIETNKIAHKGFVKEKFWREALCATFKRNRSIKWVKAVEKLKNLEDFKN